MVKTRTWALEITPFLEETPERWAGFIPVHLLRRALREAALGRTEITYAKSLLHNGGK